MYAVLPAREVSHFFLGFIPKEAPQKLLLGLQLIKVHLNPLIHKVFEYSTVGYRAPRNHADSVRIKPSKASLPCIAGRYKSIECCLSCRNLTFFTTNLTLGIRLNIS